MLPRLSYYMIVTVGDIVAFYAICFPKAIDGMDLNVTGRNSS